MLESDADPGPLWDDNEHEDSFQPSNVGCVRCTNRCMTCCYFLHIKNSSTNEHTLLGSHRHAGLEEVCNAMDQVHVLLLSGYAI